jgi:predicted PolB exonuclease-like 3'-5' exonuclease
MNIFVFDIETVPDTANGARLHNLKGLSDADIAQAMFKLRREESGTDFLRLHLQRIVAISVVLRSNDTLKVWSLGEPHSTEQELLERFFTGIEKYTPTLISWNGCAFDLPVIQYRALLHGVSSPLYWETGDSEQTFRWNNYLNRYHYRHMDLMDILSAYQPRAYARLDEIALMLGFPGKMGISGKLVWDYFQRGEIETIRNYCETDVLNTYLIYLRFELMRGRFNQKQYENECDRLRDNLQKENKPHFTEFLNKW